MVRNFSLFYNFTCTGSESSISHCTIRTSECTPWCPHSNIAIKCFSKLLLAVLNSQSCLLNVDPGTCTNGDIRLADGIIDNEGRIEICYNGVWGAVCDQGWDKTDAHVVCTHLGHSENGMYIHVTCSR